jgi:predicted nucleotidyltransferase
MRRAIADLERHGVPFALVGGFAVSARTRPRTTKDVDFAVVAIDDRDAEAVVRQMFRLGYRIGPILEHETTGRLATVRLYVPDSPSTEPDVDLLFTTCGIEAEIVAAATVIDLPGVGILPIARTGHLIAMKVLAESDRRDQDRADLRALLQVADRRELALARTAVRLIEARGFARGKDVFATLESFVREHRRG